MIQYSACHIHTQNLKEIAALKYKNDALYIFISHIKLVSVAPIGAKMWNSLPLGVKNLFYFIRETKIISLQQMSNKSKLKSF